MMPRSRRCLLALALAMPLAFAAAGETLPADQRSSVTAAGSLSTTYTIPAEGHPDYADLLSRYDAALNGGMGYSNADNTNGMLAWLQSYQMLAYMRAWKATSDTIYLDRVADQFARVLECRDDRLGRIDVRTGTSRLGWGTSSYDKAGWHVFVVHTGMICQGPAAFVREVRTSATLEQKYGTTATLFLNELEAMAADADKDFVTTASGEGWYSDPGLKGIVPLNMSNAMGSVLLELYAITGKPVYQERATALATYFKNCLHANGDGGWNWAYWPKTSAERVTRGEDISHAALNVDFASRCAEAGIVFTADDMQRFGQTWLRKVRRSSDSWSGFVDGTRAEKPEAYIPQAPGRWLVILPWLKPAQAQLMYRDVQKAFAGQPLTMPSRALGIANLALYADRR